MTLRDMMTGEHDMLQHSVKEATVQRRRWSRSKGIISRYRYAGGSSGKREAETYRRIAGIDDEIRVKAMHARSR